MGDRVPALPIASCKRLLATCWVLGSVFGLMHAETAIGESAPLPPWSCGTVRDYGAALHDYRQRDSDPKVQWAYEDNKRNHMDGAMVRLRAGEISWKVRGSLDWTLRRWPNHLEALQALIEYDVRGGRQYEFLPTECYFVRALEFAPDDTAVMLARGNFYWKKHDRQRALNAYQAILEGDPDSADANYNLGLVYFELSKYAEAQRHAQLAYSAGFPLPGLRNKLKSVGYWSDLAPAAAPGEKQ